MLGHAPCSLCPLHAPPATRLHCLHPPTRLQAVDWGAHPALMILSETAGGKYLVARRGLGLDQYGLVRWVQGWRGADWSLRAMRRGGAGDGLQS